jgi:hypothetical protein
MRNFGKAVGIGGVPRDTGRLIVLSRCLFI